MFERSITAEHPGPVRGPSEIQRRILFPCRSREPVKDRRDALDITHKLNMTLTAAKAPDYICIQRLNYNENGNLSGLMAPVNTSSMLLYRTGSWY